jgi:uncharacterized protein YjdB
MKAPQLLLFVVVLVIVSISVSPCGLAQSRGSYAAGINYPAGPPTAPSNTNFWIGGISPIEIHTGDINGDGKPDVVVAAGCSLAGNGAPGISNCPASGSAAVVYLSNGDGTFQAPLVSGANLPPSIRSMVVGDFNGDGKLDVAVAADAGGGSDGSDGTITILLGNGDGTFTQVSQYAINGLVSQANTLATGDFNGDGKLDLAVGIACYNISVNVCSVGAVSVYPGGGDGTLGTPTIYATVGNGAIFPVVGDFNGDGKLDLIAGSGSAPGDIFHSSLTFLQGKGDGSFTESITPLSFSGLSALASADLNSDGKLDLAITTSPASVQILFGNANGTFQSPISYASSLNNGATNTTSVLVTDLNHDGKPDLVISGSLAGNNGVQLFLNDGTGNFLSGPAYGLGGFELAPIVAQDFNGDGNVDVVMGSTISENGGTRADGTLSVLLGNGDGTMQGASILSQNLLASQTNSTITADINGDGIPDLVQTSFYFSNQDHGQGGIIVSLGTGNGNYGPPTIYPTGSPNSFWVSAGDFNGDGKIDLAVANLCFDNNCAQGGAAILLGNGDGTFQAPTVYAAGAPNSLAIVTGDFNGDGKLDIALMNQQSSISILLGNGDGTFQPAVLTDTSASGPTNYSIAPGDFDGDSKTDIALLSISTDHTTGLIQIYRSNGDATLTQVGSAFSSGGTSAGGTGDMSLAVADVNGDGKLDVVAANVCQLLDSNCGYGSLSAFIGNGDGTFQSGSSQTVPDGNFYSLLLADINGDGKLDAIATNLTGVAVFPGKGDGVFLAPTVYAGVSTGGANMTLAMADLNIIQPGLSNGLTAVLVNRAGTYLVSQPSANPSSGTLQITTTASASYLSGVIPTGTVSYYEGTTFLGSASLAAGAASINVNALTTGVHTITPFYSGDLNFVSHFGTPILEVVTTSAPTLVSIAVTPANPSVAKGTTQQFAATGTYSDNSTQNLTGGVTWSSATTTVATISTAGLASGVGTGTSTIKATLGTIFGSTLLSVTAPTLVSIAVTPASPSIIKGSTQQFAATGTYSDNSTQDLTSSVTWSSGTTTVATISAAGLASGAGVGTSAIKATSGTVFGSTVLTVTAPSLQSITVSPATASVAKGATQQFTATGHFSDTSTQNLTATVTWSSSSTTIATVSNSSGTQGLATGVAAGGPITITAAQGTIKGTTQLTVTAPAIVSVNVTPANVQLPVGASQQYAATAVYSDGTTKNITKSATWSSSSTAIATVGKSGLAKTIGLGSTTISASNGTLTGATTLTTFHLTISPLSATIALGGTQQFTATANFANGSTSDLTGSITWKSSSTKVATITAAGLSTGHKAGTTNITATVDGVTATAAKLTVQ